MDPFKPYEPKPKTATLKLTASDDVAVKTIAVDHWDLPEQCSGTRELAKGTVQRTATDAFHHPPEDLIDEV